MMKKEPASAQTATQSRARKKIQNRTSNHQKEHAAINKVRTVRMPIGKITVIVKDYLSNASQGYKRIKNQSQTKRFLSNNPD
jgi:hypothetical protein